MLKTTLYPPAQGLLFAFLLLCSFPVFAQKWGYVTLIAKQNTNSVQLLDTNNVAVKQWSGLTGNNGYSSYLTKGGDVWRTVAATGNSFMGGGICGRVQKIAWNGTLLFDYTVSDANQCSHHDICPLPNGNVLLIVYERKTAAHVQAAGATVNQERWTGKNRGTQAYRPGIFCNHCLAMELVGSFGSKSLPSQSQLPKFHFRSSGTPECQL